MTIENIPGKTGKKTLYKYSVLKCKMCIIRHMYIY